MSNPNPDSHDATRMPNPRDYPNSTADPQVPLRNLSLVRTRIDSLRTFLSQSINTNAPLTNDQTTVVSNHIASAIHHIIVNGSALVSNYSHNLTLAAATPPEKPSATDSKIADDGDDCKIAELDAVELLAEHIHFCEICGKGFRRDANLRMHMRAHGNQFKTPEALAKPPPENCAAAASRRKATTRFSCPLEGCSRNRNHAKFMSLKSVVCVRNHFKRSHCPKMYTCNTCHRKSFSVLSDLKSHMKHCGGESESKSSKWKCSCGTTFSRKAKLFGHVALFEGHMPALALDEKGKQLLVVEEREEDPKVVMTEGELGNCFLDDEGLLPEEFFDDFESIDNYSFT